MPRSRDVAIFVPTTDDRRNLIALPLAHARGVKRSVGMGLSGAILFQFLIQANYA